MDKSLMIMGLMLFTLLINIPFGYLRGKSRKFSIPWMLYIHLPVPLVIYFRHLGGISYYFIPIMLAAAAFGQFTGGRMPVKR